MSETPEIPDARTVRDAAGGRRPVRHLDPERVRRSPGASRVEPTAYVADRLIVRGAPPADLRELADPATLRAGGSAAEVALPVWAEGEDATTWLDGVRRIAADLGYQVVYDGRLGDLVTEEDTQEDDDTFGYALRFVPVRPDDVEADTWEVLERIGRELGDLVEDDGLEAPAVGLDHVMRAQRRTTPLPFVPVSRPRSTPLPVSAVDEYGVPGSGGLVPVRLISPPPARRFADGPNPWVTADGFSRPAVALVDTGVGSHPWFGSYVPGEPSDGPDSVVVRDAELDGSPIGTFPIPTIDSEDAEYGGMSKDPLTGPLDPVAGHGTFQAGIVHQLCPDAVLLSVRAFGGSGDVPEWEVLHTLWRLLRFHRRGLRGDDGYHPVDVVVLAMGYYHEQPEDYGYDGPLRRVLRALRRAGIVVVVAAGNDGTTRPMFPAAWTPRVDRTDGGAVPRKPEDLKPEYTPIFAVGATNPDSTIAVFSNDGPWVTTVKPGAAVVSTMPTTIDGPVTPSVRLPERLGPGVRSSVDPDDFGGGFASWSGTSFSAPYLAAEIAREILVSRAQQGAQEPSSGVGGAAAHRTAGAWDAVRRVPGLFAQGVTTV
ncbi:S8 family serine peptidase [Oerskovia flava]|uniref:S8 family serine peptidase n=1 Tax=Oerskovia flava TaxID=2986422 RepID=UPI002240CFC8|nr:S8 family serine peptidase [Oerskovia sp. JB1-3-2]